MKISNKISVLLIFVFILVFQILSAVNLKNSDDENMMGFPEFTWESLMNGDFGHQLTSFFADRFAMRDDWVSASAKLKSGMCESIVNDVYIADSRLIATDVSSRGSIEKSAEAVNEFVRNYSGAVYFVAVPTSSGVYSDILPSYLLQSTEKQQIDSFYDRLDKNIRKIDAYSILKMLSDNYIYYRSDTKWTSYGAFCVYRTVIQKLGFMPASYDKYTIEHVTDSYRGNLYSRTQYMEAKPDLLDIYEYTGGAEITECKGYDNNGMVYRKNIYDREAVQSDDMYRLYFGEKLPLVKVHTNINNNRKILVVGDDYASCFVPFLIQHYSEIAFVSPDCMEKDLRKFLNPDDYEQLLFLFGIDTLIIE